MDRSTVMAERIAELWQSAEARKERGEFARRNLLTELAYAPPAGDGDNSARAWLTEAEANELHHLQTEWPRISRREALERIQRKRMSRRFAERPQTPATADFDLPY